MSRTHHICQVDVLYDKMTCPVCKDTFYPQEGEYEQSDTMKLLDGTVAEIAMCPRCWQPLKWTEEKPIILTHEQINETLTKLQRQYASAYKETTNENNQTTIRSHFDGE